MIRAFWPGALCILVAAMGLFGLGRWLEGLFALTLFVLGRFVTWSWLGTPAPLREVSAGERVSHWVSLSLFGAGLVIGLGLLPMGDGSWFEHGLCFLALGSVPGLVLAAPAALAAARARAEQQGCWLGKAAAWTALGRARLAVFNKTGTLTKGQFQVMEVASLHPAYEPEEVLRLAAALESRTDHALKAPIVDTARRARLALPRASHVQIRPGRGLRGDINGVVYTFGSPTFLQESGRSLEGFEEDLEEIWAAEQSPLLLATDQDLIGMIAVKDELREEIPALLKALRAVGLERFVLLSGDEPRATRKVAERLGLDQAHAALLPEEKAAFIGEFQKQGEPVLMASADPQEAPALQRADVGLLVGPLSEEGKGLTLTGWLAQLDQLPGLIRLSHHLSRTITRNLVLAGGMAAGLLALIVGRLFSSPPWPVPLVILAQEAAAVLVFLHSRRLLKTPLDETG